MDVYEQKLYDKKIKKINSTIAKVRENTPEKYNQQVPLQYFTDPRYDLFIDISNRSDGKTYSYMKMFLTLAFENKLKGLLLVRHFTLRQSFLSVIELVCSREFKNRQLAIDFDNEYITIRDSNDNVIFYVSEIRNGDDLKNYSSMLAECDYIWFDEFIISEEQYFSDEFYNLKTIYESIDRENPYRTLIHPKIVLTGNAVNLSSPIIAGFDIFEEIEEAELNNVYAYTEKKLVLSVSKNIHANERKKNGLFDLVDNKMTSSEFDFNHYIIEKPIKKNEYVTLLYDDYYIKVYKNLVNDEVHKRYIPTYVIDVRFNNDSYDFTNKISKLVENTQILPRKYIEGNNVDRNLRKIQRRDIKFNNTFSASIFDRGDDLLAINLCKLYDSTIKDMNQKHWNEIRTGDIDNKDDYMKRTLLWLSRYNNY